MTTRDNDNGENGDGRLLEALRHELAKQELDDYEPTAEELDAAEPDVHFWKSRIAERRREQVLASNAVELPGIMDLAARPREWLLGRLAELRELARVLPGGVQLAHRNLDARALDDIPTEEIRSHVADLEAAVAVAMSKE
jgi:hypothetical protein